MGSIPSTCAGSFAHSLSKHCNQFTHLAVYKKLKSGAPVQVTQFMHMNKK